MPAGDDARLLADMALAMEIASPPAAPGRRPEADTTSGHYSSISRRGCAQARQILGEVRPRQSLAVAAVRDPNRRSPL
jgi:hypothetical protein